MEDVRSFHLVGCFGVCVMLTWFTAFKGNSLPFVNESQPLVREARKSKAILLQRATKIEDGGGPGKSMPV